MANLKIKPVKFKRGSYGIQMDKRQHAPFVLTSTCPKCGEKCTSDLRDDYLSYPEMGKPHAVLFAHEFGDIEDGTWGTHEWTERVVVDVTVRSAK